jgi:hypothetical protein
VVSTYFRGAGGAGRAYRDDEFTLDNEDWVFVDLWRRIGISYPQPETQPHLVLRFGRGWERRFPQGDWEW